MAEALHHKVLPGVSTIQDLSFPSILREDSQDFDNLIQTAFKNETGDRVEFNIYFGITQTENLNKLASQLFQYIQAPSLRAAFSKRSKWLLQSIKPLSLGEVPEADRELLQKGLEKYIVRKRETRPDKKKYDLAILINPQEAYPPSDEKAIPFAPSSTASRSRLPSFPLMTAVGNSFSGLFCPPSNPLPRSVK